MPSTTPWSEIRAKRPPDPAAAEREKLKIKLALLREQFGLTQTEVAERLGTSQPNISQIENTDDLKLSTVAKYVHALHGHVKITAVFGDTSITLLDDLPDETTLVG